MLRSGWNDIDPLVATSPDAWRGGTPYRAALRPAISHTALAKHAAALHGAAGVGSGNFTFNVPVVNYPGRASHSLGLDLTYNSRVWQRVTKASETMIFDVDHDWPAPGWRLGFGRIVGMDKGRSILVAADGARHPFHELSRTPYSSGRTVVHEQTTDGTLVEYIHEQGPETGHLRSGSAMFPDGRIIEFSAESEDGHTLYPTAVIDRHGNTITITYQKSLGPQIESITDSCGRVVTFGYDAADRLITISGPASSGADIVLLRLHYRQHAVEHAFSAELTVEQPAPVQVIDGVLSPETGTGYWFGEDGDYSPYGMLQIVRACRGMGWREAANDPQGAFEPGEMSHLRAYNYPAAPGGPKQHNSPTYTRMAESWAGQEAGAAPEVTEYSISDGNSNTQDTTIAYPDGSRVTQTVDRGSGNALLTSLTTYNSDGTQMQKLATAWEAGDDSTPRVVRVETTNGRGGVTRTDFHYTAGHNQVTEVRQFDVGSAVASRTITDYLDDPVYAERHLFHLPTQVRVVDEHDAPVSATTYAYDRAGLHPVAGPPCFDDRYNPVKTTWIPPTTEEHYDSHHHPPKWTTPVPGYWTGPYDPKTRIRGLVTDICRYTDPEGPAARGGGGPVLTHIEYDLCGNQVLHEVAPQRTTWTFDATTQFSQPSTIVTGSRDPASPIQLSSAVRYNILGLPITTTDVNGCVTDLAYEPNGFRVIKIEATQLGSRTEVTYEDALLTRTTVVRDEAGKEAAVTVEVFDGLGRIAAVKTANPAGTYDVVDTHADRLGRVTRTSAPHRDGDPIQWTTRTTDALGRLTELTVDGSTSRWFHDEKDAPNTRQSYPAHTVRTVDPWGRERWACSDVLGRVNTVVEPDPAGSGKVLASGGLQTEYRYPGTTVEIRSNPHFTPMPRLIFDQSRIFRYDGLGRLTAFTLPERGRALDESGARSAAGLWSEVRTYDPRGNLTSRTDSRGVRVRLDYGNDPLDRLQGIVYDTTGVDPAGPEVLGCPDVTYEYAKDGDLRRVTRESSAGNSTQTFAYNPHFGVTSSTVTMNDRPNERFTVDYDHDALGRVRTLTYPTRYGEAGSPRPVVVRTYGMRSAVTQVTIDDAVVATDAIYNPSGGLTRLRVGAPGVAQITETYSSDLWHGWLDRQTLSNALGTLLDLRYTYVRNVSGTGKTGQVTSVTDGVPEDALAYQYDTLGRLTNATCGPAGDPTWTQTYTYDRYGNRINVAATGTDSRGDPVSTDGVSGLVTDVTTNQIAAAGWAYDAAGNLVERPDPNTGAPVRFTYDAEGRLARVTDATGQVLAEHLYGVCPKRRGSTFPPTGETMRYAWDRDQVIGVHRTRAAGGGTVAVDESSSVVYFGSRPLAVDSAAGRYYLHPGRTGTRYWTEESGTPTENSDVVWFPYGVKPDANARPSLGTGFGGYDGESTTWLNYAVARFYDPWCGRFLTPDPLLLDRVGAGAPLLSDPRMFNAYTYVLNDPTNASDPLGLLPRLGACVVLDDGFESCSWIQSERGDFPDPTDVVKERNPAGRGGGADNAKDLLKPSKPSCSWDYWSLDLSYYLGLHVGGDRFEHFYIGIGVSSSPGASVRFGRMLGQPASSAELQSFNTAWSINGSVGADGFSAGGTYSPGNRPAVEVGIGTLGGSVGLGYSWDPIQQLENLYESLSQIQRSTSGPSACSFPSTGAGP